VTPPIAPPFDPDYPTPPVAEEPLVPAPEPARSPAAGPSDDLEYVPPDNEDPDRYYSAPVDLYTKRRLYIQVLALVKEWELEKAASAELYSRCPSGTPPHSLDWVSPGLTSFVSDLRTLDLSPNPEAHWTKAKLYEALLTTRVALYNLRTYNQALSTSLADPGWFPRVWPRQHERSAWRNPSTIGLALAMIAIVALFTLAIPLGPKHASSTTVATSSATRPSYQDLLAEVGEVGRQANFGDIPAGLPWTRTITWWDADAPHYAAMVGINLPAGITVSQARGITTLASDGFLPAGTYTFEVAVYDQRDAVEQRDPHFAECTFRIVGQPPHVPVAQEGRP